MLFWEFCSVCEEITLSKRSEKLERLKKFLTECRQRIQEDKNLTMYSVMRLLLPHLDRSRGPYGIKEASLAKLYLKIFCLPKDGPDAIRLLTYKVPKTTQTLAKDFADICYNILRMRCSSDVSSLSVSEINQYLENLSKTYMLKKLENTEKLLQPLLMKLSALEQKWLIRIILRDVKLTGLSDKIVLSAYHPDAKELYDVSNDLEKVCTTLLNPLSRSSEIEISLFNPFRPMLADRLEMSKVFAKMGNKPFYVETKIDGERMQIHKCGKRYGYYSRRGFDYTSNFGANSSSGSLSPRLEECFRETVTSCIIDGEMVAWNVNGSFIVSKGENIDVKSISSTGELVPCFVAFDILLLNDEVLSNLPYQERLKLLESAVKTKESVVQFPSRKLATTKMEVTNLLNDAIDQREEGIVLKSPDSIYKPNERRGGWFKVKPEYVNAMMDHLDLIILGGYHGQGRRRNLIAMFLVGVAVPSLENEKEQLEFYSFARVGSGFSDKQLLSLLEKLDPHWQKWDKNAPPPKIHCGREKPDVWINPSSSAILEIKASEIVSSNSYKAGSTLRFPRVERVREDRAWYSCMTLSEVNEMRKMASGKLVTRHCSFQDDIPSGKRLKTTSVIAGVATLFQAADTSDIKSSSNCFSDKEICVLNGSGSLTKQELERRVVSGGGIVVQHPTHSTFCIIAVKDDIRVKSLKARPKWDIVRPAWLLRCLNFNRLVPFCPQDLLVATQATKEILAQNFDRFGNSLREPTSAEDVGPILQQIKDLENPTPLSVFEIADLEYQIFGKLHKYGIFRTCIVYVDVLETISDSNSLIISRELQIISLDLRIYGAQVLNHMDPSVTHVVCDPVAYPHRVSMWKSMNRQQEVKFKLVRPEWVAHSITQGNLLDEIAYYP
ncbi:DNA ligase 4-like isoform X1 [Daphnia carinata]|uniref:DNA ligase 4-like isoform X1 n=1 Tax=Daphnia carinata TaxID=120202 RepID=UPI00257F882D|nr:DNA ligase 4-like isoform X1 [Daphnia carinata]